MCIKDNLQRGSCRIYWPYKTLPQPTDQIRTYQYFITLQLICSCAVFTDRMQIPLVKSEPKIIFPELAATSSTFLPDKS